MMHDLGLKATHKLTQQKGACQVLQINSSAGKVHDRPWKSKLARIRASGSFQKSRASQKNQSIEASSEKCIFNGPTNTIRNSSPLCTAVHSCPAASPWTNTLRKVRPGTSTFASIRQGVVAIWHRKRFVCIFQDWRPPFSCRLFALGILIRDWRIQIIQMFHRLELRLDAKGTRWWFITDIFIKLLDKLCTLSNARVIASRVARLLCTGNSTFQLVL